MTKVKKIAPYLINTLLVIGIVLLSFKIKNIYPFGEFDFAAYDAQEQYKPMLFNFIMSLKTHTLTNYTFLNGLGNPTIFNYLYYLSSPLNLFALFFSTPDSMYLSVTLLKIACASITTTYYFRKKIEDQKWGTICVISYVFCGWFLAYFFNNIWLDAFLLFPLFQLGLENLLKKKKCLLYIFTLSLLYITNFYMAFLLSVYTIFYFIFYIFKEKRTKKECITLFELLFLSTLTSFLCISFYIYNIYTSFIKMGISTNESNTYVVPLSNFIKSLFYGNKDIILTFSGNTAPNIGMNTLITISSVYYFCNKKISKKEKRIALIAICIILLAFFFPPFDKVINGFHTCIGFTFRYTFVISFMMCLLFLKNVKSWDGTIDKKIFFVLGILFLLRICTIKDSSFPILLTNLSFLLIYALFFFLYKKNKRIKFLPLFLVILETCIIFTLSLDPIKTDNRYTNSTFSKDNTTFRKTTSKEEIENSLNNNLFTNTKTANIFTSTGYNKIINLTSALGCPTNGYNRVLCSYYAPDPIKMILNIENEYLLEKIFAVNKEIMHLDYEQNNPAETQNNIIEAMTGIKNIYEEVELSPSKEDETYLYYDLEEKNVYTILIEYNHVKQPYTMEVQTLQVEKKAATNKTIILYKLNKEKLKEAYSILKSNQIEFTHYEDNYLEGNIEVKKEQVVFTSIPYDSSWEILVDGKKAKQIYILNGLLGIEVTEGTHFLSLKYKTNSLPSIVISLSTILILFLYSIYKKRIENK